jgi:hypothetical protein
MIQNPLMAKAQRVRSFNIKVTRPPPAKESGEVSPQDNQRLAKLDTMEKGIAMLSKEVQDLVEKSRKQTDIIKSVDAGMGALRKQNEEMKAKLDSIASQPPVDNSQASQPGQPAEVVYQLSQEDLDGLREVSKNMDDAIDSLKDDIPANVEPPKDQSASQSGGNQDASSGGASQEASSDGSAQPTDGEKQPEVPDAKGHQQDADAASQAQPLPGTGAPSDQ